MGGHMNYIKSMHIEGLQKFKVLDIEFNEHMNVIVGENEAGKSTILEAIKIVFNQQYRNADKSVLKDLFNLDMVEGFKVKPSVSTLPYVWIEITLDLDVKSKNSEYFYGENNRSKTEKFGITFECRFDKELGAGLDAEIAKGKIPYEYYYLKWTAFSGLPYAMVKRPFGFIAIDTSNNDTTNSFNYFNRTLFNTKYSEEQKMSAKNSFRDGIQGAFATLTLDKIDQKRYFGINDKKVVLETILSVYEEGIPLENKGSGMESLIKTHIALDKKKTNLDVILIEEPENHLCYTNLKKMLHEIEKNRCDAQIIVTTHSNMIASRLNLNNVIWISNEKALSLKDVDAEIAKFFVKADDNSFLQLLLSEKVIFVEGATEFLLMPYIYKKVLSKSVEADRISIISCNGISYKNYLKIVEHTEKKIAVITDNDKSQNRINVAEKFNKSNNRHHVFMDKDINNWTWEACLYNQNKELLDGIVKVQKGSDYLVHGVDYGKVLGKMINNKVETAYNLLDQNIDFEVPQYVKEAILWLNE